MITTTLKRRIKLLFINFDHSLAKKDFILKNGPTLFHFFMKVSKNFWRENFKDFMKIINKKYLRNFSMDYEIFKKKQYKIRKAKILLK